MGIFIFGLTLLFGLITMYVIECTSEPMSPAIQNIDLITKIPAEELIKGDKMSHEELVAILEDKKTIQDLKDGKLN